MEGQPRTPGWKQVRVRGKGARGLRKEPEGDEVPREAGRKGDW